MFAFDLDIVQGCNDISKCYGWGRARAICGTGRDLRDGNVGHVCLRSVNIPRVRFGGAYMMSEDLNVGAIPKCLPTGANATGRDAGSGGPEACGEAGAGDLANRTPFIENTSSNP